MEVFQRRCQLSWILKGEYNSAHRDNWENTLETEQCLQMHQSGMFRDPGLDLNGLCMRTWWEDCAGF